MPHFKIWFEERTADTLCGVHSVNMDEVTREGAIDGARLYINDIRDQYGAEGSVMVLTEIQDETGWYVLEGDVWVQKEKY